MTRTITELITRPQGDAAVASEASLVTCYRLTGVGDSEILSWKLSQDLLSILMANKLSKPTGGHFADSYCQLQIGGCHILSLRPIIPYKGYRSGGQYWPV